MRKSWKIPLTACALTAALALAAPCPALAEAGGAVPSPGVLSEPFDPYMKSSLESGRTEDVPWADDAGFLEKQDKTGCRILMAAYKTVLKDPLPGEEYNVHLAARYICGTVLRPGDVFSQNGTAGPYTIERGYQKGPTYVGSSYTETVGGGVCKIASTLYNVAVMSDLAIVERYNHGMPVPYVPYGQDATVSYGAKDFRFKNNTKHPILVWAQGVDNVLYIGLYGRSVPPEIFWSHEVVDVTKAPVIVVKNTSLPEGTEKITHEGMDGAVIRTHVTLLYPNGTSVIKDMGQKSYKPLPWVKEVGG